MDFKKIALSFVVAFSVCSLSAQAQSQCSKKCDKAPNEQVEKQAKQCPQSGKACDEKAQKACDSRARSAQRINRLAARARKSLRSLSVAAVRSRLSLRRTSNRLT